MVGWSLATTHHCWGLQEFITVFIVMVYISPCTNANANVLATFYRAINVLQNSHLDGLFIVAVVFNVVSSP